MQLILKDFAGVEKVKDVLQYSCFEKLYKMPWKAPMGESSLGKMKFQVY